MARVSAVDDELQGQGQTTRVREHHVVTDTVILDPESDEAVQVPEGVGADSTVEPIHVVEAHAAGTAEEQFAAENGDEPAEAEAAPDESGADAAERDE